MRDPKRIGISLLDEDLKNMINAAAKIFPLSTYEELPTSKQQDYYKILNGIHKNEIYTWDETVARYVLIGADDLNVDWADVTNIPSMFPPSTHTHAITDVDGLQTALDAKVDAVAGKGLTTVDFTTDDKTKLDSLTNAATVDYESMQADLNTHKNDTTVHVIQTEKDKWNTVTSKADATTLSGHTGNTTVHVTQTDKDKWNVKANEPKMTVGLAAPVNPAVNDIWIDTN